MEIKWQSEAKRPFRALFPPKSQSVLIAFDLRKVLPSPYSTACRFDDNFKPEARWQGRCRQFHGIENSCTMVFIRSNLTSAHILILDSKSKSFSFKIKNTNNNSAEYEQPACPDTNTYRPRHKPSTRPDAKLNCPGADTHLPVHESSALA